MESDYKLIEKGIEDIEKSFQKISNNELKTIVILNY